MKVMRFTLVDEKDRTFRVQRWCFRGSIDRLDRPLGVAQRREARRSGQEVLPAHRAGVVRRVDVIFDGIAGRTATMTGPRGEEGDFVTDCPGCHRLRELFPAADALETAGVRAIPRNQLLTRQVVREDLVIPHSSRIRRHQRRTGRQEPASQPAVGGRLGSLDVGEVVVGARRPRTISTATPRRAASHANDSAWASKL